MPEQHGGYDPTRDIEATRADETPQSKPKPVDPLNTEPDLPHPIVQNAPPVPPEPGGRPPGVDELLGEGVSDANDPRNPADPATVSASDLSPRAPGPDFADPKGKERFSGRDPAELRGERDPNATDRDVLLKDQDKNPGGLASQDKARVGPAPSPHQPAHGAPQNPRPHQQDKKGA
jgi:hypothetical protein